MDAGNEHDAGDILAQQAMQIARLLLRIVVRIAYDQAHVVTVVKVLHTAQDLGRHAPGDAVSQECPELSGRRLGPGRAALHGGGGIGAPPVDGYQRALADKLGYRPLQRDPRHAALPGQHVSIGQRFLLRKLGDVFQKLLLGDLILVLSFSHNEHPSVPNFYHYNKLSARCQEIRR